jgi:hypothetical protein
LIENSGWEFEVNTTNISRGDWKWTTTFNITLPQNKLLKFDGMKILFQIALISLVNQSTLLEYYTI